MPKCPYCKSEVHREDFYENITYWKDKTRIKKADFKGESIFSGWTKMWACPSCDTILGFTQGSGGNIKTPEKKEKKKI